MKQIFTKVMMSLGFMCALSVAHAGGGQIGSAQEGQDLVGRLVEATCNGHVGIAEIKAVIVNPETQILNYVALNVVSNSLCIQGFQGFGQPIVDMAFNSIMQVQMTGDKAEVRLQMHRFRVNSNGIVTNVEVFEPEGKLLKEYKRFNFLDFNSYPRVEKRLFHSDLMVYDPNSKEPFNNRTPELAAQIKELAK